MPLLEVAGSAGGVDPAQKGFILLNLGVNTGFDKISPVLSSVVQPFIANSKSAYTPAFNPDMII
jgi:6-phosphogluconate dehydrogenase (decarboxylating)